MIMFERVFRSGNGFALQRNTRFLAVRKVAPVDPALIQVAENFYEVAARKAIENIERAVFLFRPEEDLVRIVQGDGTTYDEPWKVFQLSKDWRDVRALSMLATDFPIIWNYVVTRPGKKKQDLVFPNENQTPDAPLSIDDARDQLENLNMKDRDSSPADILNRAIMDLKKANKCGQALPFRTSIVQQQNNAISLNVNDSMKQMLEITAKGRKNNQNYYAQNQNMSRLPNAKPNIMLPLNIQPPRQQKIEIVDQAFLYNSNNNTKYPPVLSARQDYAYQKHQISPVKDASFDYEKNKPHVDLDQYHKIENKVQTWMLQNQSDPSLCKAKPQSFTISSTNNSLENNNNLSKNTRVNITSPKPFVDKSSHGMFEFMNPAKKKIFSEKK